MGMQIFLLIQIQVSVRKKREEDRFKNCLLNPQDERRRTGTPTARAKVCLVLCIDINFQIKQLCHFIFIIFFSILQVTMEFGLDKRAQALQGLAFPLQEEAKRALQQLKQKRINYIQLVSPDPKKHPLSLIKQQATCYTLFLSYVVKLAVRDLTPKLVLCMLHHRGWTQSKRPSDWFTPNLRRPTSFPTGFPQIPPDTTSSSSNIPTRASCRRRWVSTS